MRRYRLSEIARMMGLHETIKGHRHQVRAAKRTLREWERRDGKRYLEQNKPGAPYTVSKRALDGLFRIREGVKPPTVHSVAKAHHKLVRRVDQIETHVDAHEESIVEMCRVLDAASAFLASRLGNNALPKLSARKPTPPRNLRLVRGSVRA